MKAFLATLLILIAPLTQASPDLQKLVQLVDYVGVDYAGAVSDGVIISAEEYAEMQDFSAAIAEQIAALPTSPVQASLLTRAGELRGMIEARQSAATVASLAGSLRHELISHYRVTVTPRVAPDLSGARQLYAENCAACHGAEGLGNGPLAANLEPAPIDFHDRGRAAQRSLYGLYSTITHGVEDTSMLGYPQLSEKQRWSLAFYVGQMALSQHEIQAGQTALAANPAHPLRQLDTLTTLSPAEAGSQYGAEGAALMAQLRMHPAPLFGNQSPLRYAHNRLVESIDTYAGGDADTAYRIAVDAYLEGFELMEPGLDAVAPELRLTIEGAMTQLRTGFRDGTSLAIQQQRATELYDLLDQAQARLDGTSLSGSSAFASAFLILLREGLEALLVVAALAAFLIKTGRRDGLPFLHIGWGGALLLGVVTWFLASNFLTIGGEQRELTEGIAAVVAALMLFYVGFWLHDKTHALQWKRFIEGSVQKALGTGTLWALAGLSFIAVYREVFETILFYQALWLQVDVSGQQMALSGVGAAVAVLVVLAWVILRYSTRLPLRQFFGVTGIFMFVMAVVFAGKGVAALQEAGKLPVNPIQFPRVELLGIYPNLQSLAFQLALIALAIFLIVGRNRLAPAASQG